MECRIRTVSHCSPSFDESAGGQGQSSPSFIGAFRHGSLAGAVEGVLRELGGATLNPNPPMGGVKAGKLG